MGPLRCLPMMISATPLSCVSGVVDLVAIDEQDDVGVLLDRAAFAQVRHHRPLVRPLLERPVELRQRDHRHLELLGERLHRARDLGDLRRAILALRRRLHQLQVVDDDEAELAVLLREPARARAHFDRVQRGRLVDQDRRFVEAPERRRQLLPVVRPRAGRCAACAGRAGRPSRSSAARAATRPFPSRTRRPACLRVERDVLADVERQRRLAHRSAVPRRSRDRRAAGPTSSRRDRRSRSARR